MKESLMYTAVGDGHEPVQVSESSKKPGGKQF
jgi:hypothetical protein